MQWNFFVFGVNRWQVYIFFSLSAFGLGWTKLTLAKQRFHFFLRGWVFFSINTLHVIQFGHPTKTRGKKDSWEGSCYFFLSGEISHWDPDNKTPYGYQLSLLCQGHLGVERPRGCSRIDANLGCGTLLVATRSVNGNDLLRCHHCLGNEEKKMGFSIGWRSCCFANNLMVSNEYILWWVLKTHLFLGFEFDMFSPPKLGDVETGDLNLPNPEHCTISGERWYRSTLRSKRKTCFFFNRRVTFFSQNHVHQSSIAGFSEKFHLITFLGQHFFCWYNF